MGIHNFRTAGDLDWMFFTAVAGQAYVVNTLYLDPNADTQLFLYASDGATLLASDDDGGGGLASRIYWVAPASGTYYVLARQVDGSAFGIDTGYALGLSDAGAPDAYENDDEVRRASTIAVGSTQANHNFHHTWDVDWIQFTANAGSEYAIRTMNLGGVIGNITLLLYDTDGSSLLAYSYSYGGPMLIEWSAPATGVYYLAMLRCVR